MTHIGVGIDIGGSGVKGALVDLEKGEFIGERIRYDTPEHSTPQSVAKICKTIIDELGADRVDPRLNGEARHSAKGAALLPARLTGHDVSLELVVLYQRC